MGYGIKQPTALALGMAMTLGACQGAQERKPGPLIQAPPSCIDINFPIYFEPGSAGVTKEADLLIGAARDQARGCQVTGIVIVGLADAPGAPAANLELAGRRANAVTRALHRRGFTTVEFRESALGAAGASTASGADKPLRRRADVSIHLAQRSSAAPH